MKIGVFDSGVGGLSVVNAIKKELPDSDVLYREDKQHVPYGTRNVDEIHSFVLPILQDMTAEGCKVIVIACNTVTTNLIEKLRSEIAVPLVGMEPAIRPAAARTLTSVTEMVSSSKVMPRWFIGLLRFRL